VVAARPVAVREVEAWVVVAGNPARPVSRREIEAAP
jgi:acetyltransferase-like isoleucine patch superfamily enzyme